MNLSAPLRVLAAPFEEDETADAPDLGGDFGPIAFAAASADVFALDLLEAYAGAADLQGYGAGLADLRGAATESLAESLAAARPDGGGGGGKGGGGGNGGGKGGKPTDPTDPGDPADPGLLTTYTSGGNVATSYNVTVEFSGTWTSSLQQAFVKAADFLASLVLADLPDYVYQGKAIDDLTISATLSSIDGTGGVLGQAGPTTARSGTWLPGTGIMEFDSADAATFDGQGLFDDIVLHEMVHCMGFGTLWGASYMNLTAGSVAAGDIRFMGTNANAVYAQDFAALDAADKFDFGIKVEENGGSGTAGGHWDEETFDGEIMTGYIDGTNYLSRMTVAALEDMGYDTVFDDITRSDDLVGPMPADPLSMAA